MFEDANGSAREYRHPHLAKVICDSEAMSYETFCEQGERFIDAYPAIKEFFESIVAAGAILQRDIHYRLERSLDKNVDGAWNNSMLTKAFSMDNVMKKIYKFGFTEAAQQDENMMMHQGRVQHDMHFYLEEGGTMHDFVLVVSTNDLGDSSPGYQEMKRFFDEAEDILEGFNMGLETKFLDDEDEFHRELTISGFMLPNVTVEDLMGLYMTMRYIEEPNLRNDPLGTP